MKVPLIWSANPEGVACKRIRILFADLRGRIVDGCVIRGLSANWLNLALTTGSCFLP